MDTDLSNFGSMISNFHSSLVEEQAAQHAAEEYAAEWQPQQPLVTVSPFPVVSERNVESRF